MKIKINNLISLKNKLIITFICYICYFYTASIVLVTGVIMKPLLRYFHNNNIDFAFTFINVSMWFTILIIGILMNKFSIKILLITAVIIGIISSLITNLFPSIFTLRVLLTSIGISSGIFIAIASYIIVHIYSNHKIRAMNIIFTDFFFSFGGALVSILSSYLITKNFQWNTIYLILQTPGILILMLVILSDFKIIHYYNIKKEIKLNLKFLKCNISFYCISFAAFLFLLSQITMTSYAQLYFQEIFNWSIIDANRPLSYFWISQCIGLFISPIITRFISLKYILPIFMLIALISLSCMLYIPNINIVVKSAIIFGLFNCYIYAGLLAYGTFQTNNSSPVLITTILLFGTTGTALSTTTGAIIKKYFGLINVINTVIVVYAISFILVILSVILSKEDKNKS